MRELETDPCLTECAEHLTRRKEMKNLPMRKKKTIEIKKTMRVLLETISAHFSNVFSKHS